MKQNRDSKPHAHLIRIAVLIAVVAIGGFFGRMALIPDSFGKYGPYRAEAVVAEINLPTRHMTNDSCLTCHPFIKEIHLSGIHKTVSCEFCHGTFADHVADGKKSGDLPVKKDQEITRLCLRCHNQIIRARPEESIKMISMPGHLEEKRVKSGHNCSQCHNVHAPLMWVKMAREMMNLPEKTTEPIKETR